MAFVSKAFALWQALNCGMLFKLHSLVLMQASSQLELFGV
jgi:hypothetical protein